jgi:O-antigen ligase
MKSLLQKLNLSVTGDVPYTGALIKGFVFLFPVFLVSVRHWASAIFVLMCFIGVGKLFSNASKDNPLLKQERILLSLMILFFVAFLISSLVNGWDKGATRALNTELRFLLFVPLYLLFRRIPDLIKPFSLGCIVGIVLNLFLVIYEIHYLGLPRSNGVYGPLFVGPATILIATISMFTFKLESESRNRILLAFIIIATSVIAAYSSRSALLGMMVLVLLAILIYAKRFRWVYVLLLFSVSASAIYLHDSTRERLAIAYNEFSGYVDYELSNPNGQINPYGQGSIGTRLEMYKAASFVLKDSPLFGIGRYHYQDYVKQISDAGLLNSSISEHGHPHNMFLAALFFKGLFGLVIALAIFGYCLWFFWHKRGDHPDSSYAGMAFLLILMTVGFTESAVFIKGNFIAIFLIGLGVLFAMKSNEMKESVLAGQDLPGQTV